MTSKRELTVPGSALTPREREILTIAGKGMKDAEIAALLGLTKYTVNSYLQVIYAKLDVSGRVEAAVWACKQGWL
jgi:DNA-binding NarL/FixJ family response regulator